MSPAALRTPALTFITPRKGSMQAKIVMMPALRAMTAGSVVKIAARRWAKRKFASPIRPMQTTATRLASKA